MSTFPSRMVLDLPSKIFTHAGSNHRASEINYLFPSLYAEDASITPTQRRETKALRWRSAATWNEVAKELFSQATSAIKEETEQAHELQHNR